LKTTKEYDSEVEYIHNNKYDYSLTIFRGSRRKVKIICKEHGIFEIQARSHYSGGCSSCAGNKKFTQEQIISFFKEAHGDIYDYSLVEYKTIKDTVKIICKEHGIFEQKAGNHKGGSSCPKCKNVALLDYSQIVEKSNTIHSKKYKYEKTSYVNSRIKMNIVCDKHGNFQQTPNNHIYKKNGCPECAKELTQSKPEFEIIEFIKSLGVTNIIHSNREILNGKEIDIYLPDYKIGIEYNGLLWHSRGTTFPVNVANEQKSAHFKKTDLAKEKGVFLLHIFENEWLNNPDKWKSVIRNKLHKNKHKIYARKTVFKRITSKEANSFCEQNHLQGKGVSKLNYGLFYEDVKEDKLVSVMTFSKARFTKEEGIKYEMIRFCNLTNHSIIGGASKLLSNFKKINPGGIVSYANRRWSDGHLYKTLGFELRHISGANYFYFKDNNRLWSRNKFQKHKLKDQLDIFDEKLTEIENMFNNRYRQIHDSGNYVFILKD